MKNTNQTNMGMELRTWDKINPMGNLYSPRTGHTVASNGSKIYVFGGTDRRRRQHDLFEFDIATNTWTQVQTQGMLPHRRSGALAVVHDNKMFLFGGYDGRDRSYFSDLCYFDFATKRWDQMPSVVGNRPDARTDHIMALFQSRIYIFGGQDASTRFNDVCSYDLEKTQWFKLDTFGEVPSRRFGHTGVVHEASKRLIVFGGWNGRDTLNDVHSLNLETNEWTKLETSGVSPPHRYRHTAVICGDNMFVFGGVDKSHSRFNDLQRLDLTTNTWSEVITIGDVPSSRTFHRAVVVANHMYLLGGYDGTDRLQDLYSIHVGALSPPPLLDICAEYVRRNLDTVIDSTTLQGASNDVLSYVIFRRDGDNFLRSGCKLCRHGRCSVYRSRKQDMRELLQARDKNGASMTAKPQMCVCGHSNFHHELIDERRLYGKRPQEQAMNKVHVLYNTIYKRFFDTRNIPSLTTSHPFAIRHQQTMDGSQMECEDE